MFVRMFVMRLKARAVTTKIDTNSHKSAVDHRERETSSLSYQKALKFNVDLTAEVNRAGDGRRVSDPVGDEIHQGIRGGHYGTPGTVARRVPVPRSQLHRLVADCIELVDGRLRLAGKASETLRSSSYLPSSSGWHG